MQPIVISEHLRGTQSEPCAPGLAQQQLGEPVSSTVGVAWVGAGVFHDPYERINFWSHFLPGVALVVLGYVTSDAALHRHTCAADRCTCARLLGQAVASAANKQTTEAGDKPSVPSVWVFVWVWVWVFVFVCVYGGTQVSITHRSSDRRASISDILCSSSDNASMFGYNTCVAG